MLRFLDIYILNIVDISYLFIDAHQKHYNMKNKSVIASICEEKRQYD